MNIGIITSWFERGAAYLGRAFMRGLERHGHRVFIFARGGEKYDFGPDWNMSNVHYSSSRMGTCPRCKYTGIADLEEFVRWLVGNRIEIALFNEQLDPEPMARCRVVGVKVVQFGLAYVMPMQFYRENFDLILCHTKLMYEIFRPTGVGRYVPWGVDAKAMAPGGRNLTTDAPIVFHNAGMSFGNLRKGTPALIKAWDRLPRRDKRRAKLIVHSQLGLDVLYRRVPELRPVVEGDPSIEVFVGTSKPPANYHLANVFAYPACIDSLGLTMTEAMACGMPLVTTDAQPFNEFVEHGRNGLLVRARRRSWSDTFGAPEKWGYWDVTLTDLVEKLRFFLQNPDQIAMMGNASRERVETEFDFWKNFESTELLLRKLAVGGQPHCRSKM
jgi:1,2-diacylglycerol 3-alpha-glucosyltransferase